MPSISTTIIPSPFTTSFPSKSIHNLVTAPRSLRLAPFWDESIKPASSNNVADAKLIFVARHQDVVDFSKLSDYNQSLLQALAQKESNSERDQPNVASYQATLPPFKKVANSNGLKSSLKSRPQDGIKSKSKASVSFDPSMAVQEVYCWKVTSIHSDGSIKPAKPLLPSHLPLNGFCAI